jgi:hypothetical protein
MGAFGDRFGVKLALYGQEITLNGSVQTRAIVQDLLTSQMSMYLDYAEQSLVTRPGLLLTFGADDAAAVGDTFTLGGRLYSILKVSDQRLAGEVVCRIAVAA